MNQFSFLPPPFFFERKKDTYRSIGNGKYTFGFHESMRLGKIGMLLLMITYALKLYTLVIKRTEHLVRGYIYIGPKTQ